VQALDLGVLLAHERLDLAPERGHARLDALLDRGDVALLGRHEGGQGALAHDGVADHLGQGNARRLQGGHDRGHPDLAGQRGQALALQDLGHPVHAVAVEGGGDLRLLVDGGEVRDLRRAVEARRRRGSWTSKKSAGISVGSPLPGWPPSPARRAGRDRRCGS
jgi:hypothetical protein